MSRRGCLSGRRRTRVVARKLRRVEVPDGPVPALAADVGEGIGDEPDDEPEPAIGPRPGAGRGAEPALPLVAPN